ncbi:hypothetical protein IAT38_003749 [Cryptococcus sp. DSM 104549]
MPYIEPPKPRIANVRFGVRDADLPPGTPEGYYLVYDPVEGERKRPSVNYDVELHDLRKLDGPLGAVSVAEQVKKRGFAVTKHESKFVGEIGNLEGAQAYLDETCELMKSYLGCSRVIQWNSTVRRADSRPYETVERQKGPEKDFVPTTRVQPPAGHAHVDQDETWAPNVVKMATGEEASKFKRSMIINIWRPIKGPVTNSPLCMLDFTTFSPSDMAKNESMFGTGIQIHHSPAQKWTYVRHQMPDEIVVLLCYDSDQGKDGAALFCGHVAGVIDDSEGVDQELVCPRESIEVRMVAVWE